MKSNFGETLNVQPGTTWAEKIMTPLGKTRRVASGLLTLSLDNPNDIIRVVFSERSVDIIHLFTSLLLFCMQQSTKRKMKEHMSSNYLFTFCPQTKCFICGIGNDYFDTTPHGFETHTLQEHNLANYL